MATKLIKTVKRELHSTVHSGKFRGRPIIVELCGGDMIKFRIKGTKKQECEAYLGLVYRLAQMMTWEEQYRDKMKEYNRRKKLGERCKKPKRKFLPFDKVLFKAIESY